MRRIALNPLAAQTGCVISEDVSRVGRYVNKTKPGVITQQDENTTHTHRWCRQLRQICWQRRRWYPQNHQTPDQVLCLSWLIRVKDLNTCVHILAVVLGITYSLIMMSLIHIVTVIVSYSVIITLINNIYYRTGQDLELLFARRWFLPSHSLECRDNIQLEKKLTSTWIEPIINIVPI